MTLRFNSGHVPKTEEGGRRTLKGELEGVSSSIQAIADGYLDDILTENDSGYGNRVVLSSGPDFGDGPGLYIRIEDRWYKVLAVEIVSVRPHGENELIGSIQGITNTTDISPDVGALAFDGLIQGQEATSSGQIAVSAQRGSMTIGSAEVNLGIEIGKIQTGLHTVSGNFPVLQGVSESLTLRVGLHRIISNVNIGLILTQPPPPPPDPPPPTGFEIFVETNYIGQPNLLSKYGIEDMPMLYGHLLYPGNVATQDLPEKAEVIKETKDYINFRVSFGLPIKRFLLLDVEHWNVQGTSSQIKSNVIKYNTVLNWAREAPNVGNIKVCYYGLAVATGGYTASQNPSSSSYAAWQAKNDLVKPIGANQVALFPNHYAHTNDLPAWRNFTTAIDKEMSRLHSPDKPWYLVVNPRYHATAPGLAYKLIPKADFRFYLDTTQDLGASGVVIWGADNNTKNWSETLPWWQAVKEFMGI